jgi:hypothetical protein
MLFVHGLLVVLLWDSVSSPGIQQGVRTTGLQEVSSADLLGARLHVPEEGKRKMDGVLFG